MDALIVVRYVKGMRRYLQDEMKDKRKNVVRVNSKWKLLARPKKVTEYVCGFANIKRGFWIGTRGVCEV